MAQQDEQIQATEVLQDQECMVDGERFMQPARTERWVEFEPANTAAEIHEDLYSGFRKAVSKSQKMTATVRVLPTDPWIVDHWTTVWQKQNNGEAVTMTVINKNPSRSVAIQSPDVAVPEFRPEFLSGTTDVNEVELQFEGIFTEQNQDSGVPA